MALETPNAVVAAAVLRTLSADPGAPFEMLSSNGILDLENFSPADIATLGLEHAAALTLETPVTADEGVVLTSAEFVYATGGLTPIELVAQIKKDSQGSFLYDSMPVNTLFVATGETTAPTVRVAVSVLRLIRP